MNTAMKTAMKNRRDYGFTVIELVVALVILVVLLVAVGSVTRSVTQAVGSELIDLDAQEMGESTTNSVGRNLTMARILAVQPGAPSVNFVIPVDVGEDDNGNLTLDPGEDADDDNVLDLSDGDFTAPDGTVQWGAVENGGPRLDMPGSPHQISLQFVADAIIDEDAEGYDLNGDGDLEDIFQRGHILYTTTDGLTEQYGRGAIVLQTANPQADLNNDGIADPLFSIEGETFTDSDANGVFSSGEAFNDANGSGVWEGRFRLNLWIYKEFDDARFILRNYTTTWELSDVSN